MKNKKIEKVIVMIGGGDESIFLKMNKGDRLLIDGHHTIVGESLEENKQRYEERYNEIIKKEQEMFNRFDRQRKITKVKSLFKKKTR